MSSMSVEMCSRKQLDLVATSFTFFMSSYFPNPCPIPGGDDEYLVFYD